MTAPAGAGDATGAPPKWPDVAVVVPALNSAGTLRDCVVAVLAQDYPAPLTVAVAVGPSSDGTEALARELAAADARIRVVGNPSGDTPAALNAAIAATTAPIVARVDAHAVLPPGYLRTAVASLQRSGADNVGGVQDAQGETPFEQAVAAAMGSRFGVGTATFRFGTQPGPADTVYLGVFRREALGRVGGFDETLLRNQDYELNWRIRASGGQVWFDPALRVRYRPRSTLRGLARQYFEYGRWKRVVVRRHPESLRLRQLVAPAAVIANAAGVALAVAGRRQGLAIPGVYAAAVIAASVAAGRARPGTTLRLPLVFAVIHHAWGLGFLTSRRRLGAAGG